MVTNWPILMANPLTRTPGQIEQNEIVRLVKRLGFDPDTGQVHIYVPVRSGQHAKPTGERVKSKSVRVNCVGKERLTRPVLRAIMF